MSDKTNRLTVLLFWLINGLGVAAFVALGALGVGWFQSAVLSLLGTIFLNGLNHHVETRHSLHDRLRAEFLPGKEIYDFLSLSDHRPTKTEYVGVARTLARMEQTLSADGGVPPYAYEIAWEQAHERLRSAADNLRKISDGAIELRKGACLDATIKCLRGAQETVFAISFPDVVFWRGEGSRYWQVNEEVLKGRRVEVQRFFIVRDQEDDLTVFRDPKMLAEFAGHLKLHARLSQQYRGKLKTFLLHASQVNLQQVSENLSEVPDIAIYDGRIVSQWVQKEGHHGRIDRSVIVYERDVVKTMSQLQKHLEKRDGIEIHAEASPPWLRITSVNVDKMNEVRAELRRNAVLVQLGPS